MFRTIIAAAAFAALGTAAETQGVAQTPKEAGGLTVFGKPRGGAVVVIPTQGKDLPTLRREIIEAAYTTCSAPADPGSALQRMPTSMMACVTLARLDADNQLDRLIRQQALVGSLRVLAYDAAAEYEPTK